MFVVIGTTTADVVIRSRDPFAHASADGFRAGNVVFTETPPRLLLGGNGGISAYVLAGLGVPAALCSAVGRDPFGRALAAWLEERGVTLDGLTRSDTHATSTSVIFASDAANQIVFHHPGASVRIRPEDVPVGLLADAEVLLVSSYPLMPGMRGVGTAGALARTAGAGGITALDVGPAIGAPVTLEEMTPLLPHARYVFGNTHELCRLTGTDDWESAATILLSAGARSLVVKRGRDGASMRAADSRIDMPGFAVDTHVSVGAGDAFNAGFLCGVHRGLTPEQALRLGNAVAALLVCGERGVLDAPTSPQVEAFLTARGSTIGG